MDGALSFPNELFNDIPQSVELEKHSTVPMDSLLTAPFKRKGAGQQGP